MKFTLSNQNDFSLLPLKVIEISNQLREFEYHGYKLKTVTNNPGILYQFDTEFHLRKKLLYGITISIKADKKNVYCSVYSDSWLQSKIFGIIITICMLVFGVYFGIGGLAYFVPGRVVSRGPFLMAIIGMIIGLISGIIIALGIVRPAIKLLFRKAQNLNKKMVNEFEKVCEYVFKE
ncbi:MAG: hypothetical protein K8S23_01060 [Candidatus Cloacimonetes bacterium]|nr:hypothetical protein [Candidatus Cloacimonadota bacterium]